MGHGQMRRAIRVCLSGPTIRLEEESTSCTAGQARWLDLAAADDRTPWLVANGRTEQLQDQIAHRRSVLSHPSLDAGPAEGGEQDVAMGSQGGGTGAGALALGVLSRVLTTLNLLYEVGPGNFMTADFHSCRPARAGRDLRTRLVPALWY